MNKTNRRVFLAQLAKTGAAVAGLPAVAETQDPAGTKPRPAITRNTTDTRMPIAMCQHPMWLLLKEDFLCAERDGEWGLGGLKGYSGRLRRNLELLESDSNAKLNFDASAWELEDIQSMYPDLGARLKAAVSRGQVGFVDGAYCQANLQYLSLETSVRQLQWGVRSIKENLGYIVRSFAFQDTGYTDQTPQLLKAIGYRFADYTHWTNVITQQALPGERVSDKEVFCSWTGLDGTSIPSVQPNTGVRTWYPDMIELKIDPKYRPVILDEFLVLADRQDPGPRPKVRIPYNCGYLEGTRAEELSRLNWSAETALIQLETLSALLPKNPKSADVQSLLHDLWKVWLTAQHHDAYWTGAPGLRERACGWLKDAIHKASTAQESMLRDAFPDSPEGSDSALVFAVYPKRQRAVVTMTWTGTCPAKLKTPDGKKLSAQVVPCGPGKGKLIVPFDSAGAGYQDLVPEGALAEAMSEKIESDWQFRNLYYSAVFQRDGSVKTLRTADGRDVLDSEFPAGRITAGITAGHVDDFASSVEGGRLWKGDVADILESVGRLGTIPITRRVIAYHGMPWFEIEIDCEFNNTCVGDFWDDTRKLAMQWPLGERVQLMQGIGGGSIVPDGPTKMLAQQGVDILPVNWLELGQPSGGITLINFATLKHCRKERTLYVVLAWGDLTAKFGNRDPRFFTVMPKIYDLRLNGKHTFRFAIFPHEGSWQSAEVPDLAMSLLRPPVCIQRRCNGKPVSNVLLSIDGGLIPTSIYPDGDGIACGVYEPYGRRERSVVSHRGKKIWPAIRDVGGSPTEGIRPWQIANLVVKSG